MALVFDSLGYSRTLQAGGIAQEQVEAMADAAREHIMLELVSKQDLLQETGALRAEMASLGQRLGDRIDSLDQRLSGEIASSEERVGARIDSLDQRLGGEIAGVEQRLGATMAGLDERLSGEISRLRQEMDALGLRLTVRLGAMLAAGIAMLGALQGLA